MLSLGPTERRAHDGSNGPGPVRLQNRSAVCKIGARAARVDGLGNACKCAKLMSGRYPRVPEVTGGPTPPVANTGACLYVVFTAFVLQLVGLAKREP